MERQCEAEDLSDHNLLPLTVMIQKIMEILSRTDLNC